MLAYLKDRKDEAIPDDILETAVKETVQKQIEVFLFIIKSMYGYIIHPFRNLISGGSHCSGGWRDVQA